MKNGKLSRRDVIAVTGASVAAGLIGKSAALANPKKAKLAILSPAVVSSKIDSYRKSSGLDNTGDSPNEPRPTKAQFAPKFICVVHIRRFGEPQKEINYAHFSAKQADPADRLKQAIESLIEKGQNARFTKNTANKPYMTKHTHPKRPADYTDFNCFRFGSQHKIYFYIEHQSTIYFDDVFKNYFTFSSGGMNGDQYLPNKTFYGAEKVDPAKLPVALASKGTMLKLENLYLDELGDPIRPNTPDLYLYKMNIVFLDAAGTPMLYDPTTGNGEGNDP